MSSTITDSRSPALTSDLPDVAVIDAAAAAIARPRERAADSFILHAPLELLARAALLPMVEEAARPAARERLRWLADTYSAWGDGVEDAAARRAGFEDVESASTVLQAAIRAGELDDAEGAAAWLAQTLGAEELTSSLADTVVPLLSAAAHGSIFLYHLPRVAPRSRMAADMVRGLVREIARYPGWELTWFREPVPRQIGSASDLVGRLCAPPSPGDPGSDFIYPVMSLTESSGAAREVLQDIVAGIEHRDAQRALLRVAAMSMLQDDPAHAPYGWSHCLTMPQAALGIARSCAVPWHAVAVAATYVLGFRGVEGSTLLDMAWAPPEPVVGDLDALDGTPQQASTAAWHAEPEIRASVRARLATRAALHEDAHLVKYTLACFDAAHADPEAEPLYLAAAAYLGAWWAAQETS